MNSPIFSDDEDFISEFENLHIKEFPEPKTEKESQFGLLPVRCITCGKVLGHLQNQIENDLNNNISYMCIFKKYKLDRYCCKRSIYTTINVIDEYGKYGNLPSTVKIGEWKKGTRIYLAR